MLAPLHAVVSQAKGKWVKTHSYATYYRRVTLDGAPFQALFNFLHPGYSKRDVRSTARSSSRHHLQAPEDHATISTHDRLTAAGVSLQGIWHTTTRIRTFGHYSIRDELAVCMVILRPRMGAADLVYWLT